MTKKNWDVHGAREFAKKVGPGPPKRRKFKRKQSNGDLVVVMLLAAILLASIVHTIYGLITG